MSDCVMVRFSEMARQVKTKVKPADTDLDRYVGLEHLDPESLHIRRWGVPGDVTGEKIVVRKGDVIFGKRRAYQRKVAIADFDCICSAHAMVLQPKEDVVIRDVFPFFLQSDLFMNRAVQISVGGLSPTINWKDLAGQEFPLPPIEEQRRIAEVLWAAEDVIVKDEALVAEAEHYKQVMMRELFSKGIGHEEFREVEKVGVVPKEWDVVKLRDIAQFRNGVNFSNQNYGHGIKIVNVKDFKDKIYLETDNLDEINAKDIIKPYDLLQNDDLLFVRSNGNPDLIGRCILIKELHEPCTHSSFTIRGRFVLKNINSEFYVGLFRTPHIRIALTNAGAGTNISNLSQSILSKLIVPLPPLPEQRQIASILSAIDDTIAAARASVESSKALKMQLIDQVLLPSAGDDS